MKLFKRNTILLCVIVMQLSCLASGASAQLKAGAARVDITPAVADLPAPFTTIVTKLYARALVLDDGGKRAVIVVGDLPTIVGDVMDDLLKRTAAAADTSPNNVILAVTHMHSSVRLDNNAVGLVLPGSPKITKITGDQIVECVKQAAANLQPARAGFASGAFHLATAGGEQQQPNAGQGAPAGNALLQVFKVENTSGDTIALLVNGGPEPVMGMSAKTEVQADVSGAMERYVEQRFNDKTVVMYTVGTPAQLVVNSRQRIQGTAPADPHVLMNAVGAVMGEEVLATAARIKPASDLPISGDVKVLTCPGKVTTPLNNASSCSDAPDSKLPRCVFTDKDAGPVDLHIGMIRLGDLTIIDTDSDINPAVWKEVRDKAPSPATIMLLELTYGPMHYVVPDSEYAANTYQATASLVKRGCAEKGFVDDALALLKAGANAGK